MTKLSKWYLDCVSESGDAVIGYHAWLEAAALRLGYEGLLDRPSAGPTRVCHSLRPSAVSASPDLVNWDTPGLGVRGRWLRRSAAVSEILFASPEGTVEWECHLPNAEAEIELPGRSLAGLGYVERLRVTLSPWRLPIRQLRWGRFLSRRNTLVWIDWQGPFQTRLALLNGRRFDTAVIENHSVSLPDGSRAAFDRAIVFRDASLGSTFLGAIPALERLAPARFLLARESKWLSRSVLEVPGQAPDEAWAIHEEVRWP